MDFQKLLTTLAQECVRQTPVILLGSGASAAYGIPGMWHLGEHLKSSKLPTDAVASDLQGWQSFLDVLPLTDLERALTDVTLTARMTSHVVTTTWNYLNTADFAVFQKICIDRRYLSLTKLFAHLFRSTNRTVQVITPNYDRLAEYAAEAGGYTAYTGFSYGFFGQRSGPVPPKIFHGPSPARTVNVWKVHGSFSWFADSVGALTSLPPTTQIPEGLQPMIITPGVEKYRRTHEEPFRTTMQQADQAIRLASAFLCIGYGFNDSHLQTLLVQRCASSPVPLVLITKEITATAREFLKSGRCLRYLALEENGTSTKLYANEVPDGVDLPNTASWRLDKFLDLVM
jgi:hypothetical protein